MRPREADTTSLVPCSGRITMAEIIFKWSTNPIKKTWVFVGKTIQTQDIMRLYIIFLPILSHFWSCFTVVSFSPSLSCVCFKQLSKTPDDKLFTLQSGVEHPQMHCPWKVQERRGRERETLGFKAWMSLCTTEGWKPAYVFWMEKERPLRQHFKMLASVCPSHLRTVSQSSKLKSFLWLPRRSLPLSSPKAFWF